MAGKELEKGTESETTPLPAPGTPCVYMLECADGALYTGWTNDLARRVRAHNGDGPGAKYTRTRRPCRLVYYESFADKRSAMRREWEIKNRLTRAQKLELIRSRSPGADRP